MATSYLIIIQGFLLVCPSVLRQNGTQEKIKCVDQIKKMEITGCNQEITSFEINLKEKM